MVHQPEVCPLCYGEGIFKPDPYAYLLDEVGDPKAWRKEVAKDFYTPFLLPESALDFLNEVNSVPSALVQARYIRDQTVRIITLAVTIHKIGHGGDLVVMLLTIVAEAVAKLWSGFKGKGDSRKYVHRFFGELTPPHVQSRLVSALKEARYGGIPMWPRENMRAVEDIESAVDLLYDIRCDVAHKGQYRDFLWTISPELETYKVLRECIIRGTIAVLERCVEKHKELLRQLPPLRNPTTTGNV